MSGNTFDRIPVFVKRETFCTESYPLINFHVIAYNCSCSDNDSRSVIDSEIFSDCSGRMYIYTCFGMSHFGNHSRNKRYSQLNKTVSNAVIADSPYCRVTKYDFSVTLRCRISVISSDHIGSQQTA